MIETDALVIGAGPVGLFQVFELGLLELSAQVVDALPHVGGQCAELYPDKPIFDIPGLPEVSGQDLVTRLQTQAAPFKPGLHLGHLVTSLHANGDGRWHVGTDQGTSFLARCVVIASGAGAFLPRSLVLDGLQDHLGRQALFWPPQPQALAGQTVVVLGDGDEALSQAIALAEDGPGRAAKVTLVHRRDTFRARPDLLDRFAQLRAAGALQFVAGQPTALVSAGPATGTASRLVALDLVAPDGNPLRLPLDTLLLRLGLSPRLGPLADWGLALERKQVPVNPATSQTSLPGVYAVGDISTYPGKRKLLLCGFHEATMAAYAAAEQIRPGGAGPLLYTTTSPRLHRLLGR